MSLSKPEYIQVPTGVPLFVDEGQVAPVLGHADLVTEVSISLVYHDLKAVCDLFTWFRKEAVKNNDTSWNAFSLDKQVKVAMKMCQQNVKRLRYFLRVFGVTDIRAPRQLGLGVAIMTLASGLGGYIFGSSHSPSQTDVHLMQNQNHIIQVLRSSEHMTQLNEDHIETVRKVLNDEISLTKSVLSKNGVFFHIFISSLYATSQSDSILDDLNALLVHRKFSPHLVDETVLQPKLDHLDQQANLHGHRLSVEHAIDIVTCPLSFGTFHNGTVRIAVHIPVVSRNNIYTLYRYNGAPMEVTVEGHSQLLQPMPSQMHVALSTDLKEFFLPDIGVCVQMRERTLCPGIFTVQKSTSPHCLVAMFQQNVTGVQAQCRLSTVPLMSQSWVLDNRNFLVYHPSSMVFAVMCKGRVVASAKFSGLRTIYLPPNCSGANEELRIFAQFLEALEFSVYSPTFPILDASQLSITPAADVLAAFNSSTPVNLHDPTAMFPSEIHPAVFYFPHTISSMALVAICILALGLFCRYKSLRRVSSQN